jgi:hypothetical protein
VLAACGTPICAKDRQELPPYTHLLSMTLPADIGVNADKEIRPQTAEAMNYLAQRLGFKWHFALNSDAEIYVHFVAGAEYMNSNRAGEAYICRGRPNTTASSASVLVTPGSWHMKSAMS